MRITKTMKFALLALALTFMSPVGAVVPARAEAPVAANAQTDTKTFAGQILGISKKAQTISIKTADATEMVKFDDDTRGLEFAEKGEAAIIAFSVKDGEKVATEIKPKLAKLPEGTTEIQPEEVAALVAKGGGFFLADSRPGKRFAEASIPLAVSVPVDMLKEKGESLLPPDKDMPLVFFCGGPTCGLSPEAAGLAVKWGYTNVRVMVKGLPGWKKAGNMAVAANDFVKKGNAVIIDLRSPEKAGKGFIPRAVNIPFAGFAAVKDKLPKVKSAPFVLYGDGDEPKKAIKQLAEWGYKTAAVVNGGLEGWVKAGGELATGAMAQDISYKREPEKGEVGIEEFRKALAGEAGDTVILDVRTSDEAAEGKCPGSVAIPLDELEKRMAELPRDKEILVHCTTGDRAAMAADQLRKAGFKVRHLVAGVECPEGKCVITE